MSDNNLNWQDISRLVLHAEQSGILAERGRIIKLLDELHESKNQSHHITNRSGVCVTCRAIALIKAGE